MKHNKPITSKQIDQTIKWILKQTNKTKENLHKMKLLMKLLMKILIL